MDFYFENYLMKPEDIPLVNSKRKGKFHGSMGTPNALVNEYVVDNVRRVYGQELLSRQVTGIQWTTKIKTWFPEILPEEFGRLGNLVCWHVSYNELWRIGLAMKQFKDHEDYLKITDILHSYKDKIKEAMLDYDNKIFEKGDNFDAFKRFVLAPEHQNSSVPDIPGKKWKDLDDGQLKLKFKELRGFQKYKVEHPDEWYNRGHVIADKYKVDALRYRDCRTDTYTHRDTIESSFIETRGRTARGIWPDSQNGYVYWKNKDLKSSIFEKSYEVIDKIGGGLKIRTFAKEKDKLYLEIANAKEVTYADLKSGETQWGEFFGPFVPIATSLSDPEMLPMLYKGDSGLDRTPWYNEVLSAAHARYFLEEGFLETGDEWIQGSDNICILKDMNDIFLDNNITGDSKDLQIAGLSLDRRFLGWRGRKFHPLNLIRDSARHNKLWNGKGPIFMKMRNGRLIDLMSIVIRYDLLKTDSACRLLEKVTFDFEEFYGAETLDSELEQMETKLKDIFSEEFEEMERKIKRANYPIQNDAERSNFSMSGGGYIIGENK